MKRILLIADAAEGVLSEKDFQRKVIDGVESQNKRLGTLETKISDIDKVLADPDRWDKAGKKALEDLTLAKNKMNETFEDVMKRIEKVQKQVALTARTSFRDPVERALANNEEFRAWLNAAARYIAHHTKGVSAPLDPAYKKIIEDVNQKALTGVDAGLGQAVVPIETFNEIYDLLLQYGDWASLGVQRVGARTTVLPVATARPQFYWIGNQSTLAEGATITSGAFGGGQVLLIINTLAVLMYVARELLADSTVDLAPYVVRQMIQSVNWGMDTAAFIGTGNMDTTNAGYVGVFNAALANTNLGVGAGAGRTTVGALKIDDFVSVLLAVSAEVLNRKPKWWMHPQMVARLPLIRDNQGRAIFQTMLEAPVPGAIMSILGFPIHLTNIAPNTDGNGQAVAAFGDPEGQAVGIRSDLELATSADIGFPQNLMAYRTLMRAGVKMKTQAASTTLKPFAVLSTAAV